MFRRSAVTLTQGYLGSKHSTNLTRNLNKVNMLKQIHARRIEGLDKNIWVEFTKMATEYKTVNLGQGFPDFSPPDFAKEAFVKAIAGENFMLNQYTRAFGHPPLVNILAQFFGKLQGRKIDPLTNVLVTVGAYEALFCIFQALIDEGDEVIIIEPYFDCYEPMVKMAGGHPVFVPLRLKPVKADRLLSSGDWELNPAELTSKFTKRTKAIIINTPNNPLGKVYRQEELQVIADLCIQHDVLCFSDEVYEWLVYDGNQHVRIASLPGMWERTITVGSGGKSFSATGWKVGWAIGPDHLLKHLRNIHQNSVYHCPTAAQEAVAQGFMTEFERLGRADSYFTQLPQQLQGKRDRLTRALCASGLKPIVPEGGYFLIADIANLKIDLPDSDDQDDAFDYRVVKWLIKNKGLSTIPVSSFYSYEHKKDFDNYLRFCFVKEDSTLTAAEKILKEWSPKRV
ncbi:kynurenine--oxoglutarate transaminase 1 isoform X1 [Latimeria chalumnae]|uniref:Kynurenine aminotransferase 1 n=2 Tax=Latimeria chalumnae TaxID=7897 RepID=H3B743_LATCH|nr:PREDICTED: kynurenine--oxoglutarate transaminase 1 isoform X1 [Latimeria chalumnae]|eukprot:XP_005992157.1 PREDICTED: kynurenine--oxoglutarate transaminase 1 isoform X1 [Latimeria chalumnae]